MTTKAETRMIVPPEDMAFAVALLTPFTQAYGGALPLFVPLQNEATGETNLTLPPWIELLIAAMRSKYGEVYYSFHVNHLLNEILSLKNQVNVSATAIDNFRLAVNKAMLKPGEYIH